MAYDAFSLALVVVLGKKGTFAWFQLVCDRLTDGRTDTPSYRAARTHLKRSLFMITLIQ